MNSNEHLNNNDLEEETYQKIVSAIQHPVRRRILRMLLEKPKRFSDLIDDLNITGANLSYHLSKLGELIANEKNEYKLSIFGIAAMNLIEQIEDPKQQAQTMEIVQQRHSLKQLLIDDYSGKKDWVELQNKISVVFLSYIIFGGIVYSFNVLGGFHSVSLGKEILMHILATCLLLLILNRRYLLARDLPIKIRDQWIIGSFALIEGIFLASAIVSESINRITGGVLVQSPFWPPLRGYLYYYLLLLYPLTIAISVWFAFGYAMMERFKSNFIKDNSARTGIPLDELEKIVRNV